jgi:hypothetical protein
MPVFTAWASPPSNWRSANAVKTENPWRPFCLPSRPTVNQTDPLLIPIGATLRPRAKVNKSFFHPRKPCSSASHSTSQFEEAAPCPSWPVGPTTLYKGHPYAHLHRMGVSTIELALGQRGKNRKSPAFFMSPFAPFVLKRETFNLQPVNLQYSSNASAVAVRKTNPPIVNNLSKPPQR